MLILAKIVACVFLLSAAGAIGSMAWGLFSDALTEDSWLSTWYGRVRAYCAGMLLTCVSAALTVGGLVLACLNP